MIPRVAGSGQSFQGAGLYYLNDKLDADGAPPLDRAKHAFDKAGDYALHDKNGQRTALRVGFTAILNMDARTPDDAIGQMTASYDGYRDREAHKRGRKLTKPVYVYSLAWAPDEVPTKDQMLGAAQSSLKALRLEGLQTPIVQHTDEPHPHIHILVNRIEQDGSRARNIPFDHLRFSAWAEQYERDHGGIRCEQRVQNNELRRQGVFATDTSSLTRAEYEGRERVQKADREAIQRETDRVLRETHSAQKSALWDRQSGERAQLETRTQSRIAADRVTAKSKFAPNWRALYKEQDLQNRILKVANKGGIFERACFVFANKDFLAKGGRLRLSDVARFCLSSKALTQRVKRVHEIERATLGKWERSLSDAAVRIAWREHKLDSQIMRARQMLERDGLVYGQQVQSAYNIQARQPAAVEKETPAIKPQAAPELSQGNSLAPHEIKSMVEDGPRLKSDFKQAAKEQPPPASDRADDIIRRNEAMMRNSPHPTFKRRRKM